MAQGEWRRCEPVNFRHLQAARLQAHYAVQWLARAARAFVPAQPADARTNFGWDARFGGLVTHPLPGGTEIGLRIADLALAARGGATVETLPLDGRADPEVRAWLGQALEARSLDAARLDAPPPYRMPPHVIELGARYSLDELHDQFAALSVWLGNAHSLLDRLCGRLGARRLKGPPVRLWPHHFNFDCVVALGRGRSMGLGFSPGDEYCGEPYFYVTINPEPKIPALPLLPPQGHWHALDFVAALAPAHKIVVADDQAAYVGAFFDVAIGAAIDAPR